MKRTNYKRKLLSYSVILSVFFSSFLIYSPASIALSTSGSPNIEIFSPEEGSVLEKTMVEFTGKISDDITTPDKLLLKVLQKQSETDELVDIANEGQFTFVDNDEFREWKFTKEFTVGNHSLEFVVEDEEMNTARKSIAFTIQEPTPSQEPSETPDHIQVETEAVTAGDEEGIEENRPFVTGIELMAYDRVPTEGNLLDLREPKNGTKQEKLQSAHEQLPLETDVEPSAANYLPADDLTQVRLNSHIKVTFNEPVVIGKDIDPIFVYLDNSDEPIELIFDNSGETYEEITLIPKELLSANKTYFLYVNPEIKNKDDHAIIPKTLKFTTRPLKHSVDVHGHYAMNTNSCANCHSTHNGQNEALLGGAMEASDPTESMCMACHDGTIASRMTNYEKDNKHFQIHELSKEEGYSCASCHNPHTAWTEENPNKIKKATVNLYSKSPGLAEDFSLCLRCHDGSNPNVSNIAQYYQAEASPDTTGHFFTSTEGEKAKMPCADCHETHGSSNYASLKENLGHIKRSDDDKFSKAEWSAENERAFCQSCHSNLVDIELYGKKATLSLVNAENKPISAHQPSSKSACSNCHGVSDSNDATIKAKQKRMSAAHAPKRIQPKLPE